MDCDRKNVRCRSSNSVLHTPNTPRALHTLQSTWTRSLRRRLFSLNTYRHSQYRHVWPVESVLTLFTGHDDMLSVLMVSDRMKVLSGGHRGASVALRGPRAVISGPLTATEPHPPSPLKILSICRMSEAHRLQPCFFFFCRWLLLLSRYPASN